MAHHKTSKDALRELLFFPANLSHNSCSITKIPQFVTKLSNGFEYCLIEITCDIVFNMDYKHLEKRQWNYTRKQPGTRCIRCKKKMKRGKRKKSIENRERHLLFTVLTDVIQNSTIHFVAVWRSSRLLWQLWNRAQSWQHLSSQRLW